MIRLILVGTFNTLDSDWCEYTLPNGGIAQHPAWFQPHKQADGSWQVVQDGKVIATMPVSPLSLMTSTVFPFLTGYPADYGKKLMRRWGECTGKRSRVRPWDHADEADYWEKLRANALELREQSDRAIVLSAGCNLFEWGTWVRRLDNFLMDLMLEPAEKW